MTSPNDENKIVLDIKCTGDVMCFIVNKGFGFLPIQFKML